MEGSQVTSAVSTEEGSSPPRAASACPRCRVKRSTPARFKLVRSPAHASRRSSPCTSIRRTRTSCSPGKSVSVSRAAIRPPSSVPVTTGPKPFIVNARSRKTRGTRFVRSSRTRPRAARVRAAFSASRPAPVTAETATRGAFARNEPRTRARISSSTRAPVSASARSLFVRAITPAPTPRSFRMSRCSRVYGMMESSDATANRTRSTPCAPATIVLTNSSWPGTSTNENIVSSHAAWANPRSIVMPRAFSSGRRSGSVPVSARTSALFPWSLWPAVPTRTRRMSVLRPRICRGLLGRERLARQFRARVLRDAEAVEGRRDDATGEPRPLAGGEEAGHGRRLAPAVAFDAHGRGRARLGSEKDGFVGDEAGHLPVECPQPFGESLEIRLGQDAVEEAGNDCRTVRRVGDRARLDAPRAALQEIGDAQRRSRVRRASGSKRRLLDAPLKLAPPEQRLARHHVEVLIARLDDQPCIRVPGRVLVARHPVRHDARGFRRARDDLAARAHAERVDAAPVRRDMRLLVVGGHHAARGRELRVLDEVHGVLGVLDADPHREVLAGHRDAAPDEHFHRVAGRVAEGEDRELRRDLLPRGQDQAVEAIVLAPRHEIHDLGAVTKRGTVLEKVLADVAQDDDEPIRADEGPGAEQDRGRRAEAVQRLEDDRDLVVALAAGQLPVAERAGAAFPELDVRLGVEDARRPELHHRAVAVFGRISALEHGDADSRVHERERREEARGPRPDHGGLRGTLDRGEEKLGAARSRRGREAEGRGKPGRERRPGRKLHAEIPEERGLLARVQRPAHEEEVGESIGRNAENARDDGEVHAFRRPGTEAGETVAKRARHGSYSDAILQAG